MKDILPSDYPVYGDYLYTATMNDGSEKVVRSDLLEGTVAELVQDLRSYYKLPVKHLARYDWPDGSQRQI